MAQKNDPFDIPSYEFVHNEIFNIEILSKQRTRLTLTLPLIKLPPQL